MIVGLHLLLLSHSIIMIMIINFLNAEVRKRMLVLEVYYLRHENLCFAHESMTLEVIM